MLDETKKYDTKQNINDLKNILNLEYLNSNINENESETTNSRHTFKNFKKSKTYIKTIKSKRERSKKISKKLSKIIDTLYQT